MVFLLSSLLHFCTHHSSLITHHSSLLHSSLITHHSSPLNPLRAPLAPLCASQPAALNRGSAALNRAALHLFITNFVPNSPFLVVSGQYNCPPFSSFCPLSPSRHPSPVTRHPSFDFRLFCKKSLPNLHIPNIFYIFAPEIDQIYSIIYYVYNTKGNKN